jgi:hypothetical protein
MIYAGIAITLLGFLLSVLSLGITSSVSVRLVIVLLGLAISFFGIIGLINRAYLKTAIWRKPL